MPRPPFDIGGDIGKVVDWLIKTMGARLTRLESSTFGGGTEFGGTPGARHFVGDAGEPAFTNSWVNFTTTDFAYFYKDRDRVYMGGIIKSGASGASAFTLPVGYRPPSNSHPDVVALGGPSATPCFVTIDPSGTVTPNNTAGGVSNVTAFVYLDGVSFRVA